MNVPIIIPYYMDQSTANEPVPGVTIIIIIVLIIVTLILGNRK